MPKVVKKRLIKRPLTEADVPSLVKAVQSRHATSLYGAMTADDVLAPKPTIASTAGASGPYGKGRSGPKSKSVRWASKDEDDSDAEEALEGRLADKIATMAQENAFDSDDDEDFPDLGASRSVAAIAADILDAPSDDENASVCYDPSAESLGFVDDQSLNDGEAPHAPGYKTLADYVLETIEENKRKEAEKEKRELFSPLTLETYGQVKKYLSQYRSGKLPKALKIVPSLRNWMDVLWLMDPEGWSPHAMEAVTVLFVKNLRESQVQRFLQYVALPAALKSIDEKKKLNVHLYKALEAGLYKPAAWFKGVFFPTILDEQCTYQRALILCSVLSKQSFPASNCGAAIVILAHHRPYTNVIAYCLIKLINKKHNLPLPVIASMVKFFETFLSSEDVMTVVWHQCLLTFVQRWKQDLTADQISSIREVMKRHTHASITAEIRRELNALNNAMM